MSQPIFLILGGFGAAIYGSNEALSFRRKDNGNTNKHFTVLWLCAIVFGFFLFLIFIGLFVPPAIFFGFIEFSSDEPSSLSSSEKLEKSSDSFKEPTQRKKSLEILQKFYLSQENNTKGKSYNPSEDDISYKDGKPLKSFRYPLPISKEPTSIKNSISVRQHSPSA